MTITNILNPFRFTEVTFDDTALKAYYKFEASSTPVTNDSQSAADLGADANLIMLGATQQGSGIIGNCWNFDGVDDEGLASALGLTAWEFIYGASYLWTLNFWYKLNLADEDTIGFLYATTSGSTNDKGFAIAYDNRSSVPRDHTILIHQLGGASENTYALISAAGFFPSDTDWHMITIRSSNVTNDLKYQIDNGSTTTQAEGVAPTNGSATADMKCGESSANNFDYNGKLDEASFWNRILTDAEVTSWWNRGAGLAIY